MHFVHPGLLLQFSLMSMHKVVLCNENAREPCYFVLLTQA